MTELDQLDRDIQLYREQIDLASALERLSSNKDFKQIIAKGYFVDKAATLVSLTGTKGIDQEYVLRQMSGIAFLQDYFREIRKTAENASKSLPDSESVREAVAQSEVNHG